MITCPVSLFHKIALLAAQYVIYDLAVIIAKYCQVQPPFASEQVPPHDTSRICPNGDIITCKDSTVEVFRNGKSLAVLSNHACIDSLAFSRTGELFAAEGVSEEDGSQTLLIKQYGGDVSCMQSWQYPNICTSIMHDPFLLTVSSQGNWLLASGTRLFCIFNNIITEIESLHSSHSPILSMAIMRESRHDFATCDASGFVDIWRDGYLQHSLFFGKGESRKCIKVQAIDHGDLLIFNRNQCISIMANEYCKSLNITAHIACELKNGEIAFAHVNTISIWKNGVRLVTLTDFHNVHSGAISSLGLLRNGKLMSISTDGSVLVWDWESKSGP
jgi:WD40 repeat protein